MSQFDPHYDVIVVGSGHAGVEAAMSATRIGARVLLLTQNLDTIAQMSCNPAIGGLAKGHIVREIDALGGVMGANADATGIQFRLLNRSKGPSVQAPRVQCDKKAYQFRMKAILEAASGLHIKQASVTRLVIGTDSRVSGVETDVGINFDALAIVITAGTFLRGLLHVGASSKPGGRMGDTNSGLSENLRSHGFEVKRFKTGTPCRINRQSIDFSKCEIQRGDDVPVGFGFDNTQRPRSRDEIFTLNSDLFHVEQVPCWITHTTPATHDVIRRNLHLSPLYSGRIEGTGPRYCPSIEDKVVKFSTRDSHQVFLEPEGRHTDEFYVNGVSTSLPYEVQMEFIRSIPGLADAEIMRPGYAVEYDYFPPTQLNRSLETNLIEGLYFAGQINGTSGYEEAGAQGLVAGANAALKVAGREPLSLERSGSYIGVMLDDLTQRGTEEPYRMFTSRAEDRLSLRHDTADQRLTPLAKEAGLISDLRWSKFDDKNIRLNNLRDFAAASSIEGKRLEDWLRRTDTCFEQLPEEVLGQAAPELWNLLQTELRYAGYIRRQQDQNARIHYGAKRPMPAHLDFESIPGLRRETRQRLAQVQPTSIGEASRVSGVTSADLAIISIWLKTNELHITK